jgi:hypothetical protein
VVGSVGVDSFHPVAECQNEHHAQDQRRKQTSWFETHDLIVGALTEVRLGQAFEDMCMAARIDLHTWHDIRHTSAQYMNDLNYCNIISQALGCW